MNKLLQSMQTNDSFTANGMVTHSTSLNKNVDFFFLAGASRKMSYRDIVALFEQAFAEDKLLALKVLFWARDVRGGAGERRIFEILVKYIADRYPQYLFATENFKLIPEFGRWKDLFILLQDEKFAPKVIDFIKEGLANKETQALLAKWLPRKGELAVKIRKGLGMSPKEYRKTIVGLTNVVETAMASKNYDAIDYSKLPSVAFHKYRKAFERNDGGRFESFLESVEKGEAKVNAGAIFPHVLYKTIRKGLSLGYWSRSTGSLSATERKAVIEQWNALPNFLEGNDERILTVCDVSGSMETQIDTSGTTAMDVSVSMGLYFSERLNGPFKDAWITFSDRPKLKVLKGDLFARAQSLATDSDWGGSTNLEAVFNLILNKAKAGSVPAEDMPTKILIFSDMEFNYCTRNPSAGAFQMISEQYAAAGYRMPDIVFWNLNGRIGNVPAQANQKNAALLSGFSPATVKAVLGGEVLTPIQAMLNILNSERYSSIKSL